MRLTASILCKESLVLYDKIRRSGKSADGKQLITTSVHRVFTFPRCFLEQSIDVVSARILLPVVTDLALKIPKHVHYTAPSAGGFMLYYTGRPPQYVIETYNSIWMQFTLFDPETGEAGYRIDMDIGPPQEGNEQGNEQEIKHKLVREQPKEIMFPERLPSPGMEWEFNPLTASFIEIPKKG